MVELNAEWISTYKEEIDYQNKELNRLFDTSFNFKSPLAMLESSNNREKRLARRREELETSRKKKSLFVKLE